MTRSPSLQPDDPHNAELLKNVHPQDWTNPHPAARYNLVVLGAGTAGIVAATGAGLLGGKVAIVERALLGGDCLNWGCVPSKALIRSARAAHEVRTASRFGVTIAGEPTVDFAAVMDRVRGIRTKISSHDSVKHFEKYHVEVFFGEARFVSSDSIEVGGQVLRFKKAIIATGARPAEPDIPGLAEAGFLTNETLFEITSRPARLAVIGGGPIGCEMAQAFQRLGSEVVLLNDSPQLMPREDSDVAQIILDTFEREGMTVVLNARITQVTSAGGAKTIHYTWRSDDGTDEETSITVDEILVGVGRLPNVEGLNLEAAGVRYAARQGVAINDTFQTSNASIFAAGDVCMAHKFTHAADAAARAALQNALFVGRERLSALTIPYCTFTDPEVAHVGVYEDEAQQRGQDVSTFDVDLRGVDRGITDSLEAGLFKIHVRAGTDKIVGATIVASQAGEMINELTLAMAADIGLQKLATIIHPYPTLSEAIRKIADAYNLTRLTPTVKGLSSTWLGWTG